MLFLGSHRHIKCTSEGGWIINESAYVEKSDFNIKGAEIPMSAVQRISQS